ncbi:hypothetical protein FE257_005400 [Aspergillus nanangensis]|uniref:Uncharacterized protein n=1 Tax=Aspergillus nanangensis TaxID=2582783 RepID=A0AAD4CQI6_ASPNN|nr:hypothetical protein FE257_005400 [Aspergillus nanangensis]
MAISIPGGRPGPLQSRNIAIFSLFAVLTGTWFAFRSQTPNKKDTLGSNKDAQTGGGGQTGENKVERTPKNK